MGAPSAPVPRRADPGRPILADGRPRGRRDPFAARGRTRSPLSTPASMLRPRWPLPLEDRSMRRALPLIALAAACLPAPARASITPEAAAVVARYIEASGGRGAFAA